MKYEHGGDVFEKNIIVDFSVNLNPLGMPAKVRTAAEAAVADCQTYPDYASRRLRKSLSEYYALPDEYFICSNGAAALIFELAQALRPQSAMIVVPTFGEYARALKSVGTTIWHHILLEENQFCLTKDLFADLEEKKPQVLFLCNPNNPTGNLILWEKAAGLLEYCRNHNIRLVIDECFLGFTNRASLAEYVAEYPQLFLINAFTKLYCMPGIRSGYGISSDRKLLERIRETRQDWNLSQVAQEASIAALLEGEYVLESREFVEREREFLVTEFKKLGLVVYDGDVNFLLLKSEKDLYAECLKRGILIRDCGNFAGLSQGFYRIAVRGRQANEFLVRILGEIING